MNGRVCVIVGAEEPLAAAVCRQLAARGATVVATCATGADASNFRVPGVSQPPAVVDLSSRSSIRAFVSEFKRSYQGLHLLINHAQTVPRSRQETADGIERTWASNVLGLHQLTARLIPMLRYCRPARILNVVSSHAGGLDLTDSQFRRRTWSSATALRASAQAQHMLTWAWAAGLDASTVTVNAIDPGPYLSTRYQQVSGLQGVYLRAQDRWSNRTASEAAKAITWAATHASLTDITDTLLVRGKAVPSAAFRNREKLLALISLCEGTSQVRVQYNSDAFFQEEYDSVSMNRTFQGF
jgi:NAD(P)-dependent dehydrogenase (short-subunit alcohol dehydrogenase family)